MNLTLKQLFKFGAACTCACALSATAATNYVADSFEVSDGGSDGLAISQYKAEEYVDGGDYKTNYLWFAEAGDASSIETNSIAYTEGDGPIADGVSQLALNLETEGNTLSRTTGVAFVTNSVQRDVYIDTLIQFTPSEDDPDLSSMSDVKVALWVNAESNLVVRHSCYNLPTDYTQYTTNSVIDLGEPVDPTKWYRLTLRVMQVPVYLEQGCQIRLDGTLLTHDNAYDFVNDQNGGPGANLFMNVGSSVIIEKVSFQGTGMVDEFVVTDTEPDFGSGTAVQITLVAQGGTVTFSANPINSGDSVTIEATDDWKWLASLDGPVTEAGVVDAASITTTLTAIGTESCTVTAVVEYADNSQSIGGGSYPFSSVGPWAEANGLTEASDFTGLEDDYLLNVAPDTNAELTIESITVDGTDVTIVVGNTDNDNVNLDNINGTLKLYSTTTLGGTWTEVGSASIGSGDDTVQIDISGIANATDFFKAVVE